MHGGASTPVAVTLATGAADEERVAAMLRDLFARHALDKWRYAEEVRIEAGVIPHSHPVITLNTQYLRQPRHLLTDYLHEQLHWFSLLAGKPSAAAGVIDALRAAYPDLPTTLPEGCGSDFSNNLHLQICALEFLGLRALVGDEEARAILGEKRYYTRIYGLVLRDTARMVEIIARHDALPPALPPARKVFRQVG